MMALQTPTPYWRLSGFYFFYFAGLGILSPYWALYLDSIGMSAAQIGELIAVLTITKLLAPYIWGWIADHTGRGISLIRWTSLLAAICFSGVLFGSQYWWLILVMASFSFFWNAALPQFEAVTMRHLGETTHHYSKIRLWGSIGFIASVIVIGRWLEQADLLLIPVALLVVFCAIWLSSLFVPDSRQGLVSETPRQLWPLLKRRPVVALLLGCLLIQASHGPYYGFYTLYLEQYGYGRQTIGLLWALGVVVEVLLFLFMHHLIPRFGARRLLQFALAASALRWCLIAAFAQQLVILTFAQTLHAASFGIVHAVAIYLIHQYFPGRNQGRGQALYTSVSFGVGGAMGSLYAGYLWQAIDPSTPYWVAGGCALLALVVISWGLHTHH